MPSIAADRTVCCNILDLLVSQDNGILHSNIVILYVCMIYLKNELLPVVLGIEPHFPGHPHCHP